MAKVCPAPTNHRMGNHGMGPAEWGFLFAVEQRVLLPGRKD
jgi:hypothetical protein